MEKIKHVSLKQIESIEFEKYKQQHNILLKISEQCFEIKKICISVILGGVSLVVTVFYDKVKELASYNTYFIVLVILIIMVFHIYDSYLYKLSLRIRCKMKELEEVINESNEIEQCDIHSTSKLDELDFWRRLFSNTHLGYIIAEIFFLMLLLTKHHIIAYLFEGKSVLVIAYFLLLLLVSVGVSKIVVSKFAKLGPKTRIFIAHKHSEFKKKDVKEFKKKFNDLSSFIFYADVCDIIIKLLYKDSRLVQRRIMYKLSKCDFVILICTDNHDKSDWINAEISKAEELNIKVVKIEKNDISKLTQDGIKSALFN